MDLPDRVASLGYRTDLALLLAGGSTVEDRGDHLVVRSPHNPDHYWGNFLLVTDPPSTWTPQRWRPVFDEAFPDVGHVALGFDGTTGHLQDLAAWDGLPAKRGGVCRPEAAVVLTATSVRPPSRPDGTATYRPLSGDDDWEQSIALRMATFEGPPGDAADAIGEEEYLRFSRRKVASYRELVERGLGAWWGAFLDGRLVSQLGLFTASPGLARYQSVETHPDVRGQGLAGTLVHRAACYGLDELGARTLVIVADPEYLAIRIYRALGFTDAERQLQVEGSDRVSRPTNP